MALMEHVASALQNPCRLGSGVISCPCRTTCLLLHTKLKIWEKNLRHKSGFPASIPSYTGLSLVLGKGIILTASSNAVNWQCFAWQLCCYPAVTVECGWCSCSARSPTSASVWRLDLTGWRPGTQGAAPPHRVTKAVPQPCRAAQAFQPTQL